MRTGDVQPPETWPLIARATQRRWHRIRKDRKRKGLAFTPCFLAFHVPTTVTVTASKPRLQAPPPPPPTPLLFATWARSVGPVFRSLRSVDYRSTSRSDPRCETPHNGGRPRRCLRADAGIVQARSPRTARGRPTFFQMHWEADKEGRGDFRGPGPGPLGGDPWPTRHGVWAAIF